MCERKKKPTLEQIRTLFPFEVPDLARTARIETGTVYQALLQRPIHQSDAEKIVQALIEHTHLPLTLEQIDIFLWEKYLTLWLIRASALRAQEEWEQHEDAYHLVYARDQQEAVFRAQHWLEQHPHLPSHTFIPCSNGFEMGPVWVPGICPDDLVDEIPIGLPF